MTLIQRPSASRTRADLYPYQKTVIERLVRQPFLGVFVDPGLGKTATCLFAIQALKNLAQLDGPVIVISTPRICASVWKQEAQLWEETCNLEIAPVIGTPAERRSALAQKADVYLWSIHSIRDLAAVWRELSKPRPGLVICDESTLIKTPSSKRARAVIRFAADAPRRWVLTGTPRPNSMSELWSQIFFIDNGATWGRSFDRWQREYMQPVDAYARRWIPKPGAPERVVRDLEKLVISIKAKDVAHQIPPMIDIVTPVTLPDDAMRRYRQMEAMAMTEAEGAVISVNHAAAQVIKMQQIAGGFLYDENGDARHVHDAKIEAARELVEQAGGAPVLIWSAFRETMDRLAAEFPAARRLGGSAKSVDALIDDWNAGRVPVLIAHPASGGHGLNLAKGGSIQIWSELPRSAEAYVQACHRLHRTGQTETVRNYILEAEGTIDEVIRFILRNRVEGEDMMRAAWALFRAEARQRQEDQPVDVRALRRWAAEAHPDRGGSEAEFKRRWSEYEKALQQK